MPYHCALAGYLRTHERELWDWFASAKSQSDYTEHLRLELLKSTYRLDPESHPELYEAVNQAKQRLELDIPVTVYQAQQSTGLNASLFYIPGEGHIVLFGSVLALLGLEELKSLLGHELAHYHLWQQRNGEFLIADRLLQAIADAPGAADCHVQSARWFQLYTEIFADRGSYHVTGDLQPVVSGLVKIQTGLAQVSGASYLKQADEIFEKSKVKTEQLSHPEAFIRARALKLWAEGDPDSTKHISSMIEGAAEIEELDLLGQARLTELTRRLLEQLLRPKWFQTEAVMGHARLFFSDFAPAATPDDSLVEELKAPDKKLANYLCYVLLDFVAVDPELEEMPLAAAFDLTRRLELEGPFEKLVTKELKVRARDLKRIKESVAELLTKAEVPA